MDVLSDVLNSVRISGSVLFRADFAEPFAFGAPPSREYADMLVPNARRLMLFHLIAEGGCMAYCDGMEPMAVKAGDIVMLPYGDALLFSDPTSPPPRSIFEVLPPPPWREVPYLELGGSGAKTRVLCGFLHADEVVLQPLLASMPPMVVIPTEDALPRLKAIQTYTLEEVRAGRPGGASVVNRLAEILFVEVLRHYIQSRRDDTASPLASLTDPVVGRALTLLHAEPARPWTVKSLAQAAATSRSLLSERFNRFTGCPPMQYLTRWRMQLAARRLVDGTESTAAIAVAVGYESEPAFNRAFKRHLGEPPATWRRRFG